MCCGVKCIRRINQARVKNADLRHPSCTVVMQRCKSASPVLNVVVVVVAATVAPSVPSIVIVIIDLPMFLLMTCFPIRCMVLTNHLIRARAFVCDACKLHSVIHVTCVLLPKPSPLGYHGFMS